jgi:hypothetical protein
MMMAIKYYVKGGFIVRTPDRMLCVGGKMKKSLSASKLDFHSI